MTYRKPTAWLLAAACLVTAHHALGNMRCGAGVIEAGDSMAAVKALCGAPSLVEHSVMVSSRTIRVGERGLGQSNTVVAEVPVEIWTYDRGPNKLMVSVRFVNGTVVAIETLHQWGD